jgi:hypothetical protein
MATAIAKYNGQILKYDGSVVKYSGFPPFNPTDLTGLIGWYGDTVNSRWISGPNDRTTLADNALITCWDNQVLPIASATRMDCPGNYVIGESTVFYDKDDDTIDLRINQYMDPFHSNLSIGVSSGTTLMVMKLGDSGGEEIFIHTKSISTNQTNRFHLSHNDENVGFFSIFLSGYDIDFDVDDINTASLISVSWVNGGLVELKNNGVSKTTGTLSSSMETDIGIYRLGALDNNGMKFQELIQYDRKLTTKEMTQVETYLNNKYNLY